MPHALFNLGSQTGSADLAPRTLIPGITPGGSRLGHPTKPALLIRNAWLEIITLGASPTWSSMSFYLKLSQETDLSPGLLLPIGSITHVGNVLGGTGGTASGDRIEDWHVEQWGSHIAGLVFAPRVVGVRVVEAGTVNIDADVHLDYEQVDVPWMDWLIMWDYLDNIADNDREY